MKKFWIICYRSGGGPSWIRFDPMDVKSPMSYDVADKHARRLAETSANTEIVMMEAVKLYERETPPIKVSAID